MASMKDVSAPSVPSTKKRIRDPDLRRKSNRQKLMEATKDEVRHLQNAAAHRGDKGALDYCRELTSYVAGALAVVQPYHPNGTPREGGDKEEFWEWMRHMKDLLALRLPYERPRLASIIMREERPEDREGYTTIYELRARMIEKGVPVDHLIERRMILDHELTSDDAGAHDSNGHATNGGR
jgi:hypothetical protein